MWPLKTKNKHMKRNIILLAAFVTLLGGVSCKKCVECSAPDYSYWEGISEVCQETNESRGDFNDRIDGYEKLGLECK